MIKLVGFNYKKISAEKKSEFKKDSQVNLNIEIKDIKKQGIDVFKDQNTFNISYEFHINYTPNIANISFSGTLVLLIEDKDLSKDVESSWKNKKIPKDFNLTLKNIILNRLNTKALQLEEDLNLPLHNPAPKIAFNNQEKQ